MQGGLKGGWLYFRFSFACAGASRPAIYIYIYIYIYPVRCARSPPPCHFSVGFDLCMKFRYIFEPAAAEPCERLPAPGIYLSECIKCPFDDNPDSSVELLVWVVRSSICFRLSEVLPLRLLSDLTQRSADSEGDAAHVSCHAKSTLSVGPRVDAAPSDIKVMIKIGS